jgi:hypothetical protein
MINNDNNNNNNKKNKRRKERMNTVFINTAIWLNARIGYAETNKSHPNLGSLFIIY